MEKRYRLKQMIQFNPSFRIEYGTEFYKENGIAVFQIGIATIKVNIEGWLYEQIKTNPLDEILNNRIKPFVNNGVNFQVVDDTNKLKSDIIKLMRDIIREEEQKGYSIVFKRLYEAVEKLEKGE